MADNITSLYNIATEKHLLKDGMTEEAFRQQTSTEEGRKSFYDYAQKRGLKMRPYEEYTQKYFTQDTQTEEQDAQEQAIEEQTTEKSYWQSIGANDPYAIITQANLKEQEQEQERETAYQTVGMTDEDIASNKRKKDLEQNLYPSANIDSDGIINFKPQQYSLGVDGKIAAYDNLVEKEPKTLKDIGVNKEAEQELEEIKANQPSYLTRGEETIDDIYQNALERSLQTPEGKYLYNQVTNKYVDEFKQSDDYKKAIAQIKQGKLKDEDVSKMFENKYGNTIINEYWGQMNVENSVITPYINEAMDRLQKKSAKGQLEELEGKLELEDAESESRVRESFKAKYGAYPEDFKPKNIVERSDAQEYLRFIKEKEERRDKEYVQTGAYGSGYMKDMRPEKTAAKGFVDDARKVLDAAEQGKWFFSGFGENIADKDTWDFGINQLTRSSELKQAIDKFDKGEKLTEDEELLLEAATNFMAVSAYYSDNIGRGYKAGQTTAVSLPFMLQFAVSAGAMGAIDGGVQAGVKGSAKAVVRGLEKFAAKKMGVRAAVSKGSKVLENGFVNTVGKITSGLISSSINAGLMTSTFGMPKVIEGTISRETGDIKPTIGEDGKTIVYGGIELGSKQSKEEAIKNSVLDQFIENWSEMGLAKVAEPIGVAMQGSRLFSKLGKRAWVSGLMDIANTPWLKTLRKTTQFQGLFGEIMEEEVGGLARWATMSDVNSAEEAGLDLDSQIDIILGLAPTSLAFGGFGAVSHYGSLAFNSAKFRKNLKSDAERQMFDSMMEESRSGAFGEQAHDFIRNVLMNSKYTQDEKKAIFEGTIEKYKQVISDELAAQQESLRDTRYERLLNDMVTERQHKDGNIYETRDKEGRALNIVDGKVSFAVSKDAEGNPIMTVDLDNSDKKVKVRYIDKQNGVSKEFSISTADLTNAVGIAKVDKYKAWALEQHKASIAGADTFAVDGYVYNTESGALLGKQTELQEETEETKAQEETGQAEEPVEQQTEPIQETPQPKQDTPQEGVERYRDKNDEEVEIQRNTDGSVAFLDEKGNAMVDEHGNAIVMSADEFNQFAADSQLTRIDPQTEQMQQIRQQAEQEVALITNKNDGKVYEVVRADDETKNGHIVSGSVEIDTTDPDALHITNNDVVTVRYEDGTVEQLPAKDLNIAGAPIAAEQAVQLLVDAQTQQQPEQQPAQEQQEQETPQPAQGPELTLSDTQKPDIDNMDANTLGAATVEYMKGDKNIAKAYLQAERDKAEAEVKRLKKAKVTKYTDIDDFMTQQAELEKQKKDAADRLAKLDAAITSANAYKTQAEQQAAAEQPEQQPANQQTQPTVSSTPAGNEPAETNKGEQVGQQPKGTNAPQEGGQNLPRGRKQVAKYIEKLKEVANRLSEQSTSGELNEKDVIEALTYIAQIESNLSHVSSKDDVIFADEEKLIERVKNLCNAYGYEVQPLLGLPYNDGMPVIADFVVDETQKKSSAINNSTDTADTLAGKRNDTATPQNTANSSAHKGTTSVPNNQTPEQKSVEGVDTEESIHSMEELLAGIDDILKDYASRLIGYEKVKDLLTSNLELGKEFCKQNGITSYDELKDWCAKRQSKLRAGKGKETRERRAELHVAEILSLARQAEANWRTREEANNTKETREQTNQRLAQERKERILSEGTSFDQDFGLVAPKDITEPQQISDNIVEIVKGLAAAEKGLGEKGKSGSGYPTNPLHKYGGWVYGEGHIANAQHQVEEYLQALDVLDPKILNEWKKQNGIKTYKDLRDKVEKLYNQIKERWTEHDLTQPELTLEQKQSLIHDIADGNTKVALVTNKTLVKKMTELGATRKDIAEAINALTQGLTVKGFYLNGTVILNSDALNTGMDIIQTFVHERQHLLTKNNPQILDTIIDNLSADQLAKLLQTIAKAPFYNRYNDGTENGHRALADEFLSHIMQEAYATDQDADAVAQQYGITNQDILTTLHNLDYEQRQSDNLSKARRNVLVSRSSNNRGGKSSRDSQARTQQVDEQRPRSNQSRNNTPTTGGQTSQNGVEQTLFSTDGSQSLAQLNDQFNKRLDELIADPTQKDRVLHLGRASQFLRDGGISDAEIVLEYDKLVAKAKDAYKNKHPFNLEDVKGLPKAISEPIAVFHNTNGTGNDVILTELQKDGNNFIVTIETQRKQRKGGVVLEVNEISTLFPKEARGIVNWVNLGEATNIDKEKALHFIEALRNHHGTSITSEELDLAAKIVQNFENPKLPEENDTRFSISGTQVVPLDEHTLVGLHNISADKLRKALKAGGLANPSAAVIDIAKQNHHGYGEISLVMPSALVDSKSGRNAGTYAGDAYTPTYPSVEYREGKETPKRIKNLLKDLPTFMQDKIARDIHYYMQGNIYNTGLPYLFLAQRGQQPSIVQNERQYPHITLRDIYDRLGIEYKKYVDADAIRGAHDKLSKDELYDFNLWLTHHGDPQEIEKWNDQLDKVRKANKDKGERAVELLKERAIDYKSYINDINAVAHDEVAAGNENYDKTVDAAKHIISEQGLTDEYNKWEQETLDNLGYEEVLFAGYTPMGNRRYLPNTIENASRLMNQKANTNSNDGAGVSETKALLMDKFKTLSDIRDHKDILEGDSEKVKQAYEQTSDDWFQLGIDFRDYTLNDKKAWGLSDNQFIASDEALARLQEAMLKRNPIAHLNAEYNYSLSADSEFGKRLMDMKERIKNLPSKYFETKFNRPVYLNEFRNAVIPNNLPQDLRDGLSQAGLGIYEYDPANETTSRREATLQATEDSGIRFSVSSYTPETDNTLTDGARQEMQAIRDEAIANGTYMIEPNGNRTNLTERQWLQVRTKAFKKWFGDWLKAARIDKLRKSEPVVCTKANYEGKYELKAEAAQQWIKDNLRGEYTNKDTGETITLTRIGTEEVTSHSRYDAAHLKSISIIPELIENSIFITEMPATKDNGKFDSYRYYVVGVNIDGEDYTAKVVIGVKQGKKYYDHRLTQIEKTKLIDSINQSTSGFTTEGNASLPPYSGSKDTKLISILQTNCSKIVDENGAPLLVYHGTPHVGFSVFNTVGRFRGENSTSRNTGVYATDDRNLAYIYTSREDYDNKNDYTFFDWDGVGQVYSLFMNIKNPLTVECGGADFDEISIGGRKTSTDAVVRKLRKGGFDKEYDGAVFKNVYDGDYTTDYIALSPNQIKSATDNNGSFDNADNDIRFQIIGEQGAANLDKAEEATTRLDNEQVLRDVVIDRLRENGIEVITDTNLGQSVLDEVNKGIRLQAQLNNLHKAANTIRRWIANNERGKSFTIELPTRTLEMIDKAMGRDFDSHRVTADGIAHAKNNHGIGGKKIDANSIPLRDEDFELAPYIMTAPDAVKQGSVDRAGRNSVRFEKRLSNGIVIVVEKENDSPNSMNLITMWADRSSSNVADARSNRTSPTLDAQDVIISSDDAAKIRKDAETAIENDEKISGTNTIRGVQYHKVSDQNELDQLNNGETVKVYRAMQVIDGNLYPPMAASIGGKLVESNDLGQWIRADENPDLAVPDIDPKTGKQKVDPKTGELKWKFNLDKGGKDATGKKATSIPAAYNPYWHTSRSPLNDQFKSAWIRPNIVIVECEVPISELTSGYKAERAKDAVGEVDWKSGSVSSEVFKQTGRARKVILSRWCKPVRILSDAEVAQKAKEFIGEADVTIPENVITPKQRVEFEKAGLKIGAPEKGVNKSEQIVEAIAAGLEIDNSLVGSKDMPRFFRTANGEAYGFTVGGKIYIDTRIADADTPIHEYAHLWATALRQNNPKEWANIVGLMKDTPLWDEVKKDYSHLTTDDEIADEVLARYSGKRGAERLRKENQRIVQSSGTPLEKAKAISALERVRKALSQFWEKVADLLHIHFTTAEEVADRVLYDLLNATDLKDNTTAIADYLLSDNYVKALTGNEFQKDETPITKKVAQYYKENYGGRIERKNFGEVILDERSVKDSIAHGIGRTKAAAFAAVPEIIRDGVQIDEQENWKGRNRNSFTFAAPVQIGEKPYVGIVIVTRGATNGDNHFYLHEVILQESLQSERNKTDIKADTHNGDIAKVLQKIVSTKTNPTENSTTRFSVSPVPPKITGETTREWAKRIADWRRQQLDQQQVNEYKQLLEHNQSKRSKLYKFIVDKFTAIDNFQQWILAHNGNYDPDTMDMHGDLSLAFGRIATFQRRYKDTYIQHIADNIAAIAKDKKLNGALLNLNLKWQNFEDEKTNGRPLTIREIMGVYAQAKDTQEAADNGLPDRGAQGFINNLGITHYELIDAVESALPKEAIDNFWDAVYAANQFALDYQLQAGLIDQATRDRYERRYYVPQRGWRERDFDGYDTNYVPEGARLYGNPYNSALVKAHGRQSLASDPFALIESIGLTSISQSEHNRSKQQFLNLLLANENIGLKSGAWTVRQIYAKNVLDPTTGRVMRHADGTPFEAEVVYAAPTQAEREHDEKILAQIEKLRKEQEHLKTPAAIAKRDILIEDLQDQLIYVGRATDTMIEHRTRDEKRQHQVVVLKDGQQYLVELQDEALANAVNGNFGEAYNAYKLLNKLNTPAIRYMSGMLTQFNPRFANRNFHRDAQAAFINNMSELGVKFATKAAANIPMVQRTIWAYIWSDAYHDRETYSGMYGDYLREYFEAGAQTGFSFMPELERMAKDFDKMVKGDTKWDKVWNRGVKGTLSLLTEASELTVRFAQYVTARQLGYSTQEAAKMAKNITTNFNQSGILSKEMSKYFTFFNATVQGNMREMTPQGKNRPAYGKAALKFGAKLAGVAADFALLGLLSVYLNPDDPDDETWFTEYDRMSNFIVFGTKIPVVHFFRMFYAAGVQAALAAQGRKTWKDAALTAADYALSEITPTSVLQLHNMFDFNEATNELEFNAAKYAQSAAPSVVSPVIDVLVNRDFKGSTVYRKKWDEQKKNITTAKRNTPQWAIDAANTLHQWSGGNPEVPYGGGRTDGWIDIKPNAIEHIAQGYLSGVWESLGHTAGFVYDAAAGGDDYKSITNYPFLRDLFRDYSEDKAYNQEFYKATDKMEAYRKRYNSMSREEQSVERKTDNYKTYQEVERKLQRLPNPLKDDKEVSPKDINAILQLNQQLNRNLFKDE